MSRQRLAISGIVLLAAAVLLILHPWAGDPRTQPGPEGVGDGAANTIAGKQGAGPEKGTEIAGEAPAPNLQCVRDIGELELRVLREVRGQAARHLGQRILRPCRECACERRR